MLIRRVVTRCDYGLRMVAHPTTNAGSLPAAKSVLRQGVLARLARDTGGNTLAIIAASVIPILAMVGGGIDMGRSYLSQSRLQQACDAGVLAARKKLGSQVVVTGDVPADVATVGDRFFNLNFRGGAYGTEQRDFQMTLENDYAISGVAKVKVPTTIMGMFGYDEVDLTVECQARLNFSNTDVMMVLDTTGSMNWKNPGDSMTRIEALRSVVKSFHGQIEGSKKPGTRVRYGFVPYATNVNVGTLLKSDWMVDEWTYQSREPKQSGSSEKTIYSVVYEILNEGRSNFSYDATTCPGSTSSSDYSETTTVSNNPHEYWYISTTNGDDVWSCIANDTGTFTVSGERFDNHQQKSTWKYSHKVTTPDYTYRYKPMLYDVSPLKGATGDDPVQPGRIISESLYFPASDGQPSQADVWYTGCIEERETYPIDDYSNVDLTRALDLDLDLVPTPGNPETQWRPQLPGIIFDRAMWWNGSGSFSPAPVNQDYDFLAPGWSQYAACPGAARNLDEMNASDIANYVDNLPVAGSTYHDIGMIWGGRLISPTGLFAAENADEEGSPTSRHLIFLTDGETQALDVSYSSYGVEPLDQRRWSPSSPITLTETVERRFGVACNEVKKRNVTVWVVGFGVGLNPIMEQCAGAGHHFTAADAAELNDVFSKIAQAMGDLRVSK